MPTRITNVPGISQAELAAERDALRGETQTSPFQDFFANLRRGSQEAQRLGSDAGVVLKDASLNSPFDLLGLLQTAPELFDALGAQLGGGGPGGFLPALSQIEPRGAAAREALLGPDSGLERLRGRGDAARDRLGLASIPLDLLAPT